VLERVIPEVEQPCSPPTDSGTLLTVGSEDVLGLGASPSRMGEGDTPSKATSARRDDRLPRQRFLPHYRLGLLPCRGSGCRVT
jgi:hypothetical protein